MVIVVDIKVFYTFNMSDNIKYKWVGGTMDGKDNMEKKTTKVAEKTDVSTRMWYAVVMLVDMKVFFFFNMSYKI